MLLNGLVDHFPLHFWKWSTFPLAQGWNRRGWCVREIFSGDQEVQGHFQLPLNWRISSSSWSESLLAKKKNNQKMESLPANWFRWIRIVFPCVSEAEEQTTISCLIWWCKVHWWAFREHCKKLETGLVFFASQYIPLKRHKRDKRALFFVLFPRSSFVQLPKRG